MNQSTVQKISFGILLVLVTAAFLWLIRAFLQPIFWAIALGILVYPAHARLAQLMRGRPSLTAAVSMLLVVLLVVLPLLGVITAVTSEAAALYGRLDENEIDLAGIYLSIRERVPQLFVLLEAAGFEPQRVQEQLSTGAVQASQFVAERAFSLGQNTVRIAIYFFLMLYLLFFFLRDGVQMLDALVRALPLGDERERHLLGRFTEVSRATIKGTLVIGVVQGTIGGITFAMLGIEAPVMWGFVMGLLSILPAIGPALVWAPAAVIMIVSGQYIAAGVLIVVGTLVIGLVDNLLRPILVGRDTKMPDYLILLSTLGGLAAFGLAGIVIGPIIAAFFLSVWHMAEEEYAGADSGPFEEAGDDTT